MGRFSGLALGWRLCVLEREQVARQILTGHDAKRIIPYSCEFRFISGALYPPDVYTDGGGDVLYAQGVNDFA